MEEIIESANTRRIPDRKAAEDGVKMIMPELRTPLCDGWNFKFHR